jgi:hypothetical protein
MQIPSDTVERMLPILRASEHFQSLPATNRHHKYLWNALDRCLLGLRLPLYNQRLGKKPATPKARDAVIQQALTLLGAFATAVGTHRAILSSYQGRMQTISFQPRPYEIQWSAEYAIDPVALTRTTPSEPGMVTVEDMLFLAAKIVHAVSGHNMNAMPDATSTIEFLSFTAGDNPHSLVHVTVRETSGATTRDGLAV